MATTILKVFLFINPEREAGKQMISGIAKYVHIYGPWIFYKKFPYYEKSSSKYKNPLGFVQGQKAIAGLIRSGQVQGFIGPLENEKIAKAILPKSFPSVIVPTTGLIKGRVNLMHSPEIGQMAAEYFQGKGLKHFAFCGYMRNYWSSMRCKSFREYLEIEGHAVHVYDQSKASSSSVWQHDQSGLLAWLQSLPKPIGIWAWNDEMASSVIEACRMLNIGIPDEVAILGVDNDDLVCNLCVPQLSSILLDLEAVGFQMAKCLHAQMLSEADNKMIDVTPLYVQERQSTNIHACEDPVVSAALRYIHDNANNPIQVDDVVQECGVSRRSLYEFFRTNVGRSIYKEIELTRAEAIKKELLCTDMAISQIAMRFGYTSGAHISRFFKKIEGLTPSQYRKKHKPVK